ncbi:MAG TPA: penicillin acylase family protein, partial [Acidobacteriaceae bacterium]|nr:penicillin acylase family protein [Acidobacteriaceae bacterium]
MSRDEESLSSPESSAAETVAVRRGRGGRIALLALLLIVVLAAIAFICGRIYFGRAMRANLPQLDGSQVVFGLSAPVTVERDTHGVPHIRAQSLDDLVFAQGYITAQDRLWQM